MKFQPTELAAFGFGQQWEVGSAGVAEKQVEEGGEEELEEGVMEEAGREG